VLHVLHHLEEDGFPLAGRLTFLAGFLEFVTENLYLFA
jgi:hypothetical protein